MFPHPMRRGKIKSVILLTRGLVLGQGTALNLFWLEPLHCNIIPSRDKSAGSFGAEAAACRRPPQGWKGNSNFLSRHLSLTLMNCLPWNSSSPRAKITHTPHAATGVREADATRRRGGEGGEVRGTDVHCFYIDLIWCKTSSSLCSPAVMDFALANDERKWRAQRQRSVTHQCLHLTWQRAYARTQTSRGSSLVVTWFISPQW